MRSSQDREDARPIGAFLRVTAAGVLAGGICSVVLTLLLAGAFVLLRQVPQGALFPLTTAVVGLGAFGGGWTAGRLSGAAGFFYGLCCGLFLFLLLVLCGICFLGRKIETLSFLRLGVMLLTGMAGGMVGVSGHR